MKNIKINNITTKYWNGTTYSGFVYLDGVKTRVEESIKSDMVDILLAEGVREAYLVFQKELTDEQLDELQVMKPVLMKNSIGVIMDSKFRLAMKSKCARYIRDNF